MPAVHLQITTKIGSDDGHMVVICFKQMFKFLYLFKYIFFNRIWHGLLLVVAS